MKLGGYFVNLSTARKVAQHLNIDVGEDTSPNNRRMEIPINNWLHDNEMLHIKSGLIKWPVKDGEYGILFISRFRQTHDPERDNFIEGEKDLEVRKWLMNLNLDAELEGIQLEWATLIDGITISNHNFQTWFRHLTDEEFLERIAYMKKRGRTSNADKV